MEMSSASGWLYGTADGLVAMGANWYFASDASRWLRYAFVVKWTGRCTLQNGVEVSVEFMTGVTGKGAMGGIDWQGWAHIIIIIQVQIFKYTFFLRRSELWTFLMA